MQTRLDHACKNYEQWRRERAEGNWQLMEFGGQEMPKASDIWKQQVGGLGKLFEQRGKKLDAG